MVFADDCEAVPDYCRYFAPAPPPHPFVWGTWTYQKEERDIPVVGRRTWLHICDCGATIGSRTHVVEECEICKKERAALEEEMRKLDVCDMEEFGRLESSEKTIAILGDRWWPQTAKQDGDGISKQSV